MSYIAVPFGYIMKFCYNLLSNYGLAIILFTLLTKVLIFPVSLWNHKNSIKLIELQPELNKLKIKYFGEKDILSDKQLELYKKKKYHPLLGMVPMLIQIFLLLLVIQIIYNPLTHILSYDAKTVDALVKAVAAALNIDPSGNSIQLTVVNAVHNGFTVSGIDLSKINNLNMHFLGFDLSLIPLKSKGISLIIPVAAGLSALALALFQNKMNPVQAEQNKTSRILTNAVSVGISLFLGGFVPIGIGLYWIFSNLFTMLQQVILNLIINPKKHIDYEELEKTKEELNKLSNIGNKVSQEDKKREKRDYKKFFSIANKHLVFYSESNGFYKYFQKTIEYLNSHSNIIIHYITSDPNDNIFELAKSNDKIRAYYIGEKKLITLFIKMDADIVVMTMPDIENFHYKRSYIKKDIEYIYMFHYPLSTHMVLNKGALDHYDTIFCIGDFQFDEIRKQEEIYHLKEKKLISVGYSQLELINDKYSEFKNNKNEIPTVLIAPSWQKDNILDSCLKELVDELIRTEKFRIIVRPHPEYVKRYKNRVDRMLLDFEGYNSDLLNFELDFTSNDSIYKSDIVITDWSGTAYEFSFVTLKPCIFIDTPVKINNKDYKEIGIEPLELKLRNIIGKSYQPKQFSGMSEDIINMTENPDEYKNIILEVRNKYIANFGESGKVAGRYIVNSLIEKSKKQENE